MGQPSESNEHKRPAAPRKALLHAASGATILGLDWVLFSGTLISAGTAMWPLSAVGFVLGALGVVWIQRRWAEDALGLSLAKGFVSGLLVGAPFPIAGTAVGGFVLAASGLDRLRRLRSPGGQR